MSPSQIDCLLLSPPVCRVHLEVKEGARPGSSEASKPRRVGVLKQKYFEADRAFIYFVWDYYTGTTSLIGRVTRPQA